MSSDGKVCGSCGCTFIRPSNLRQAAWAARKYCNAACAGEAQSRRRTGHRDSYATGEVRQLIDELFPVFPQPGACHGADPTQFDVVLVRAHTAAGEALSDAADVASIYCAGCPIVTECGEVADSSRAEGIWGGSHRRRTHAGYDVTPLIPGSGEVAAVHAGWGTVGCGGCAVTEPDECLAADLEAERESGRAKTCARIARTGDPFLGAAVSDPDPF